jgi:nucleoside phosphorylase
MSDIAVFAASDLEYRAIRSVLSRWQPLKSQLVGGIGYVGENRIELYFTNMGPHNAARQAASALGQSQADFVLVSGFAGSLQLPCQRGDLVLYDKCYYQQENRSLSVDCHGALVEALANHLAGCRLTVKVGAGLTVPRVLCRVEEKRQAGQLNNAIAVDMESFQILTEAARLGRAAAVLRLISDDLSANLPDLNRGLDAQAEVSNLKMLLCLGAQPLLSARFLFNLWRSVPQLKRALADALGAAIDKNSRPAAKRNRASFCL